MGYEHHINPGLRSNTNRIKYSIKSITRREFVSNVDLFFWFSALVVSYEARR